MERHIFQMRLRCNYATDNEIQTLEVEHLNEGEWTPLVLNTLTPGFLIFTYATLTCQHLFLRMNALERELQLDSSQGSILIDASPEWHIEKLHVDFSARLKSGNVADGDIDYITGRMQQCPVSKNLAPIADAQTMLQIA